MSNELCNAIGYLTVAGRQVGLLRCGEQAGHDDDRWDDLYGNIIDEASYGAARASDPNGAWAKIEATPHAATLTWTAEVPGIDWPDALDPNETFDAEVPLVSPAPPLRPSFVEPIVAKKIGFVQHLAVDDPAWQQPDPPQRSTLRDA